MTPRLSQPLFAGQQAKAKDDKRIYHMVRAYDCIWTLLKKPDDISYEDARANAAANLYMLGDIIENALGVEVFEADPRQLELPGLDECDTGLIQTTFKPSDNAS